MQPEKGACPRTDMDLEDGKPNLQLEHIQTAQDHWVSYKHLLGKRIHDSYPKEEGKKIVHLNFDSTDALSSLHNEKKQKKRKHLAKYCDLPQLYEKIKTVRHT